MLNHYEQCERLGKGNLTPQEVAQLDVQFIRSQDGISIYKGKGKGRILSAQEVWHNFPHTIYEDILNYGSAILTAPGEPENTIKSQREKLGLDIKTLARNAKTEENLVKDVESGKKAVDFHTICNICQILNIDDYTVSTVRNSSRPDLSVRLKKTRDDGRLTNRDLPVLTRCAWIAEREVKLQELLGNKKIDTEKNSDYGSVTNPAYNIGYMLARQTRELLDLEQDAPIPSMRDVCAKLRIPYIQTELSDSIAGLTLASGDVRSIVVNTNGRNSNPWLRRVTVAHELGHLLWDPNGNLDHLNLDTYDEIESSISDYDSSSRWIEQRANAFAVEFLLPVHHIDNRLPHETVDSYLSKVMNKYGVSFTSAKQHLQLNGILSALDVEKLENGAHIDTNAPDEWRGKEDFTIDFFPIQNVQPVKRGKFSYWVCKALQKKVISVDSATSFLGCGQEELLANRDAIVALFEE